MNYRHAFHAGNACDVVKHAAFSLVLKTLTSKGGPLTVLDTHAGAGIYDLQDAEALKTGESQQGIARLWKGLQKEMETESLPSSSPLTSPLDLLAPYQTVLARLNPEGNTLRFYPGSPLVAREILRPAQEGTSADRLVACELHSETFSTLQNLFRRLPVAPGPEVQLHRRDGYEALKALMPKPGERGLVLIDPPYEEEGEWDRLTTAVRDIGRRWPGGRAMIWYPLKDRSTIWRWHESLRAEGVPGLLAAECRLEEDARSDRLAGTGLVFVNPPWRLEETLVQLFPLLQRLLDAPCPGTSLTWITPSRD